LGYIGFWNGGLGLTGIEARNLVRQRLLYHRADGDLLEGAIPAAVRQYVFERDRFQCQNCGRSSLHDATVKLNVDHIIAVANGGSDDLSNLQTLCDRCNQQKSKHYSDRFRRRFL